MVIFVSFVPKRRHISKISIRYVLFITTLECYGHCSSYMARVSAPNKPTLLAPDSRLLLGDNIPVGSVSV